MKHTYEILKAENGYVLHFTSGLLKTETHVFVEFDKLLTFVSEHVLWLKPS